MIVTAELIRSTIAEASPTPSPEPEPARSSGNGKRPGGFDVRDFLDKHGLTITKEKTFQGGTLFVLEHCPFNAGHTAGESAVFRAASGMLSFKCFHNSCDGKTWHDLRRAIGAEKKQDKAKRDNTPDIGFTPLCELLTAPVQTQWIIKHILDAGLCVLFGEAESMKTFVAIDQAVAISCEDNWQGHKIPKNGPVFYICGEGRQGIAKRFKARTQAAKAPESAPVFVSNAPMQGMEADSVRGIMDSIDQLSRKHGAPVVIFIDTLNRNFGAGDESSTKDMTTFIANLDNEIKRRFDVAVVIVHHSGLVDKDRSRGSGALRAALDWEYKLTKNSDNVRTLSCTKCKDHDRPEDMHFLPEIIDLPWKDEDGEPMTSVVLRLTEPPTARDSKLTGAKRVAKDALFHLTCIAKKDNPDAPLIGPVPIHIEDWREAAYQRGISPSEKQDAKKKAFQRAVTGLLDMGIVEADGDYYTLL